MKTIRNLAVTATLLFSGCATIDTSVNVRVPVPDVGAIGYGGRHAAANGIEYGGRVLSTIPNTGGAIMQAIPETYEAAQCGLYRLGANIRQKSSSLADEIRD